MKKIVATVLSMLLLVSSLSMGVLPVAAESEDHVYDGDCDATCNMCEQVREVMIGHSYELLQSVEPSCTEEGYRIDKCTVCGELSYCGVVVTEGLPESEHPYANNINEWYTYSIPGATALVLQFSEKTHVEEKVDFIYIYAGDSNKLLGGRYYSDKQLAGAIITVPSDTVRIKLRSDWAGTKYGFSLTSVTAMYEEIQKQPPLGHVYDNACDSACNECGATRNVGNHQYDNASDTDCNECGQTRPATWMYTFSNGTISRVDMSTDGDLVVPDNLGSPVKHIGNGAFNFCKVTSVTLPEGLLSIGSSAFGNCTALTALHLPDSLKSMGHNLFFNCGSLAELHLPAGVEVIEDGAFLQSSLKSITVDENNPYFAAQNGVLFNKEMTELLRFPPKSDVTSYTIPDSVTTIGNGAFYGCKNLIEVIIPDSVTAIGKMAFEHCASLKTVHIPCRVTAIGESAFENCTALASVVIGDGVTDIDSRAFAECANLIEVSLGAAVTRIVESAFTKCANLSAVYYRGGREDSGRIHRPGLAADACLFSATWYYNACIGAAEHAFPDGAMSCAVCGTVHELLNYRIDDEQATILGVKDKTLTDIVLPDTIKGKPVTAIGAHAFQGCTRLKNVKLPKDIKTLGDYVFNGCISLSMIDLPIAVVSIGNYAFHRTAVKTITYVGDVEQAAAIVIRALGNKAIANALWTYDGCEHEYTNGCDIDCNVCGGIRVPDNHIFGEDLICDTCGAISQLLKYTVTADGAIILGVTDKTVVDISLPDTIEGKPVIGIGAHAFQGCKSLKRLTLPKTVASVGNYAFNGCVSLKEITLPSSVVGIGNYAFHRAAVKAVNYDGDRAALAIGALGNKALNNAVWNAQE